ncbi:hypothetical protein GF406_13155 [candidate division KSB1 bacterium]|nr:hypothetical protein [candidate division KSB1 bacterium]
MNRVAKIASILILIFQWALLYAQSSPPGMSSDVTARETTNIGRFKLTLGRSAMTGSAILKDRDTHFLTYHGNDDQGRQAVNFNARSSLLGFGARNWTAPDGTNWDQVVLPKVNNVENKLITKYPFFTLTIDGRDKSIEPLYDEVQPDLISDQMIVQTFETDMGLNVTARAYAWAEPGYDDFAILHYEIVNNGSDLQDFIISQFHGGQPGSEASRHDPGIESHFCNFYGADPDDSLNIWYWFDGDDPKNNKDDEGNPHTDTGEFLSPEYWGWGLIHADKSPSDHSNDVGNQPTTAYRTAREILGGIEDAPFYDFATSGTFPPYIDPDSGYDPFKNHDWVGGMTVGPYDVFPAGDTLNVVFFCGFAAPSIPEAQDMGAQWMNGEISEEQKNDWLRSSRDELFGYMSKATQVWENDLQLPPGDAPSHPGEISLNSGGGEATVEWQDVGGNVTYDLYRATVDEELLGGGSVRLRYIYLPIATDLNVTNYTDTGLDRGETYYYYVVSKDAQGLQSSHYYLRNPNGATIFAPSTDDMATIRVVPNPYNISEPAFAEQDRIVFAGLPGPCEIKIFTQSGDLVAEIDHPYERGIAGWDQISGFNQLIKSGIYIYHVKSTEGMGEKIGKFVVIR